MHTEGSIHVIYIKWTYL